MSSDDYDATLRRMCATMLTLQAIVLALAVPVLVQVAGVKTSTAMLTGFGLSLACLLTAGLLRHRSVYWIGHLLQVATIALGLFTPAMYAVGALFAVLWFSAYLLGRRIADDRARWSA